MRVSRSIALCWLIVVTSQFSCSDSGDGGGGISTGLPASQKLSSLDNAEAKKVCTGVARGFNNLLPASEKRTIECASQAIPLSYDEATNKGDVAKCKQLVERCLNGETISEEEGVELEQLVDEEQCDEPDANAGLMKCDATVGDLESCGNALIDEYASRIRLIDCDNLADIENTRKKVEAELDPAKIPACKTIATDCPEIELGN